MPRGPAAPRLPAGPAASMGRCAPDAGSGPEAERSAALSTGLPGPPLRPPRADPCVSPGSDPASPSSRPASRAQALRSPPKSRSPARLSARPQQPPAQKGHLAHGRVVGFGCAEREVPESAVAQLCPGGCLRRAVPFPPRPRGPELLARSEISADPVVCCPRGSGLSTPRTLSGKWLTDEGREQRLSEPQPLQVYAPGDRDEGQGEETRRRWRRRGRAAQAPAPGPPRRLCQLSSEQVSDTDFPGVDSQALPLEPRASATRTRILETFNLSRIQYGNLIFFQGSQPLPPGTRLPSPQLSTASARRGPFAFELPALLAVFRHSLEE